MYVVADTLPAGAFSNPVFQLHALSLVDGHEMFGGPVQIAASVPGTGAGSNNGTIAFDASQQLQRPGLMLANGELYVGFGSHADAGNYQGWMLEYNPSTLQADGGLQQRAKRAAGGILAVGACPRDRRQWNLSPSPEMATGTACIQLRRIVASSFRRRSFSARLVHSTGMEQPQRSGLGSWIGWNDIDSGHQLSAHAAVSRECCIW